MPPWTQLHPSIAHSLSAWLSFLYEVGSFLKAGADRHSAGQMLGGAE